MTVGLGNGPDITAILSTDEACESGNGSITFSFTDNPNQTAIAFSIDGGVTWPTAYNVSDNSGSFTISNLSSDTYDLQARWGNGECLIDLADETIASQVDCSDAACAISPLCCSADAGTIATSEPTYCLGTAVCGIPSGDANIPNDYETTYFLVNISGNILQANDNAPCFTPFTTGNYSIHTLVGELSNPADSNFINLDILLASSEVTLQTIDTLLIQGGGAICGSLDLVGASFTVINDQGCNSSNAMDDIAQTLTNVAVTGNVLTNDSDNEGDSQSTTLSISPSNGTVVLNIAGTYTYTPNADFIGEDKFVYEVCDDVTPQACDYGTVFVEVLPALSSGNDAPIAHPDFSVTFEDAPISGILTLNDDDVDGDPLIVTTASHSPTIEWDCRSFFKWSLYLFAQYWICR